MLLRAPISTSNFNCKFNVAITKILSSFYEQTILSRVLSSLEETDLKTVSRDSEFHWLQMIDHCGEVWGMLAVFVFSLIFHGFSFFMISSEGAASETIKKAIKLEKP